jgi:hypothetical protein
VVIRILGSMNGFTNFIKDTVSNWGDYRLVFHLVGVLMSLWFCSCLSALTSIRWTRRDPETRVRGRFWFAFAPLVISAIGGIFGQIPLAFGDSGHLMAGSSWVIRSDLRWLCLLPAVFGAVALTLWWKTRWTIHHSTVGTTW